MQELLPIITFESQFHGSLALNVRLFKANEMHLSY